MPSPAANDASNRLIKGFGGIGRPDFSFMRSAYSRIFAIVIVRVRDKAGDLLWRFLKNGKLPFWVERAL